MRLSQRRLKKYKVVSSNTVKDNEGNTSNTFTDERFIDAIVYLDKKYSIQSMVHGQSVNKYLHMITEDFNTQLKEGDGIFIDSETEPDYIIDSKYKYTKNIVLILKKVL